MAATGPKHKRPSIQGLEVMSNDRSTGLPIGRVIEDITGFTGPISDFVEGPEPDVPVAREIHQRLRSQCDSYSNAPSWFTGQSGGFQVGVGLVCDKYLESQGSGGPTSEPAFESGQCDCGQYRYRIEVDRGGGNVTSITVNVAGPVSGIGARERTGGTIQYYVTSRGASFNESPGVYPGCGVSTERKFNSSALWGDGNVEVILETEEQASCGDAPTEPEPNPNPRPDPGLDPEDEPFERAPGQPVFPMPPIENPFGEPVQLPNFPGPPIFGIENEGESSNPNVGPPITPGEPQDGNGTDGEDDDFGEPPEGHIWVGFVVELSDQGVSEGLQPNSPPEPIYRATTGNYRAKYDVEGETVYSSPRDIRQRMSAYFLDLAGLTLTGARVNVPSNDSYIVTPLSQPVTEEEEEQDL